MSWCPHHSDRIRLRKITNDNQFYPFRVRVLDENNVFLLLFKCAVFVVLRGFEVKGRIIPHFKIKFVDFRIVKPIANITKINIESELFLSWSLIRLINYKRIP